MAAKKKPLEERTQDDWLFTRVLHQGHQGFYVETPSGQVSVAIGDFIALRSEADVYPIRRENFVELYEPVEEVSKKEAPKKLTPAELIAQAKAKVE